MTKKTGRPDLHILIAEEHAAGCGYSSQYFHINARIVVQKFEDHQWTPYGHVDDDYNGPLYSCLRIHCQGDDDSRTRPADREQVYGFSIEYHDVYSINARKAERMFKTLRSIDAKLAKMQETRGYVRSFGEYLGRIAEAIGAKGIGIDHQKQRRNGYRWEWLSIGDGANRANHMIWQWVEDGKPKPEETATISA